MNLSYRTAVHHPSQPPLWTAPTPSRSFVKQFLQILRAHLNFEIEHDVRNVRHGLEDIWPNVNMQEMRITAPDLEDRWGLVIGRGTYPLSAEDYRLYLQIKDWEHPYYIRYMPSTVSPPEFTPDSTLVTAHRAFRNYSLDHVAVFELGIYTFVSTLYPFCIVRDVCDPIDIPPHHQLSLEYIFKTAA